MQPQVVGRALIIDDEEVLLEVVGEVLAGMGFQVDVAPTIARGRELALASKYDLLVIDKNLPDGSGLELAGQLNAGALDAQLMLMSGYATLSSAVEALQAGVADFLVKPFDLADLRARVQRAMEALALRRANRSLLDELRTKNAVLEGLATRDPLTGLENHASFQESLRREIARSRRAHQSFALLLVGIDKLGDLNARLGFGAGDALLRAAGELLRQKCDAQGVFARFSGDTFAVLLPETDRISGAARADDVRRAFAQVQLAPGAGRVSVSAGVAAYPADGQQPENLISAAAAALEAAKAAGRDQILAWSEQLTGNGRLDPTRVRQEVERAALLQRAISSVAFRSVYQPIVDLRERRTLAFEALGRPLDPGFRSILDAIEIAERSGQVAALGEVLRQCAAGAATQLAADQLLFVNVHPQELLQAGAIEGEAALRPHASRVVLELTESAEIQDFDHARARIDALHAAGFRIAVDDLGAGYSGLNNLALLSPDFVKLDMQMVRGLHKDGRAARLIRHILEFCRGENARVIAEGIETLDELTVVRELGVDLGQGYLFAKPGPAFPVAQLP